MAMRRPLAWILAAACATLSACGDKPGASAPRESAVGTWTMRMRPSKEAYANLPPEQRRRVETGPEAAREGRVLGSVELREDGNFVVDGGTFPAAGQEGTWSEADGKVTLRPKGSIAPAPPGATPGVAVFSWRDHELVSTEFLGQGVSVEMELVLQRK